MGRTADGHRGLDRSAVVSNYSGQVRWPALVDAAADIEGLPDLPALDIEGLPDLDAEGWPAEGLPPSWLRADPHVGRVSAGPAGPAS